MYNNAQAYQQQAQPTVQGSSITFVNGLEGAKGYMLPPNNTVILTDSDNSKFYIKSTDAVGMATMANPIKQLVNNTSNTSFNEYGGVQGVLSKFNEFKNQFKGNPQDIVNNMLRSGRINEP